MNTSNEIEGKTFKLEEIKNKILLGNNVEVLKKLPAKSVDLIFADPPYNLQLKSELYRPNQTKVDGVFDEWDKFDSIHTYGELPESGCLLVKEC